VQARWLFEFFEQFELDEAAHRAVAERARARGLAVMSTPFDLEAVDLLERVGIDAYKIASGDITFHQLIARAAATGKPLVISTGMSDLAEVGSAVSCARDAGAREIAVLHCVSAYPVPEGSENLRAIATLAAAFDVPVGLSDHTTMREAAVVATALGATVYERHLVTDSEDDAIDRAVSSTPEQLAAIVRSADRARRSLGDGVKSCLQAEAGNRRASRRGLYAARALGAGDVLRAADMVALRPATGADPRNWRRLAGCRVTMPVAPGDALHPASVDGNVERREVSRAV
jgi:sialic acid synthase SpsE